MSCGDPPDNNNNQFGTPPCYTPKCESCPYAFSCKNNPGNYHPPYIVRDPMPWENPFTVTGGSISSPNITITTVLQSSSY